MKRKVIIVTLLAMLMTLIAVGALAECSHSNGFQPWKTTKEPTCTTAGMRIQMCKSCTYVIREEIPALGHTEVEFVAKEHTCTEDGYTSTKCTVCGEIVDEVKTIREATGHKEFQAWKTTKEPTCTTDGLKIRMCKACTYVEKETLPALGHTEVEYVAKEHTCTEDGYTSTKCSVCGELVTKIKNIRKATGHKEFQAWKTTKEPTCTTDGLKIRMCKSCTYVEKVTLPALGHTEVEFVAKEHTCTEDGYTSTKCSVCGELVTKIKNVRKASGHKEFQDWKTTKEPTCTTDGLKIRMCKACTYVEKETLPALGHTENVRMENIVHATCCADGSYDAYCLRCDGFIKTLPLSKTNAHKYEWRPVGEVKCEEPHTEKLYCANTDTYLGIEYNNQVRHHKWGEWLPPYFLTDYVPGRVTEVWYTRYCQYDNCDAEENDFRGYNYDDPTLDPNATVTPAPTDDPNAGKPTQDPNGQDNKPAPTDDPNANKPTRDPNGQDNKPAPTDDPNANKPTQDPNGQDNKPAPTDDPNANKSTQDPNGQDNKPAPTDDPNANKPTQDPNAGVVTDPNPDHQHSETVMEGYDPTCTEPGREDGTICGDCGELIGGFELIPPTGHTPVVIPAVPATPTEKGLTEGLKCGTCGEILKEQYPVDYEGNYYDPEDPDGPSIGTQIPFQPGDIIDPTGENVIGRLEDNVITDPTGEYVGSVDDEGNIIDENGNVIGKVDENGKVTDKDGKPVGDVFAYDELIGRLEPGHPNFDLSDYLDEYYTHVEDGDKIRPTIDDDKCIIGSQVTLDSNGTTVLVKGAEDYAICPRDNYPMSQWIDMGNGTHMRICTCLNCDYYEVGTCVFFHITVDEVEYKVCPICGHFTERAYEWIKGVKVGGVGNMNSLIARDIEAPFGTAPVQVKDMSDAKATITTSFTAVKSTKGALDLWYTTETLHIPMVHPGDVTLMQLNMEGEFAEVPYVYDNGFVIFNADQHGLYLFVD